MTPALGWLEELLAAQGTTAEETVRLEHQRQAAMNVTVRNVITSMRLISWFDWAEFVESVSLVDEVLRSAELASADMDFATRDRYRHADRGARPRLGPDRGRGRPEPRSPAAAGGRRRRRRPPATTARRLRDPGYYLIPVADPRSSVRSASASRWPTVCDAPTRAAGPRCTSARSRWRRRSSSPCRCLPRRWRRGRPGRARSRGPCARPASDLAVSLVNRLVTSVLGPRPLPRLELTDGVPPSPADAGRRCRRC